MDVRRVLARFLSHFGKNRARHARERPVLAPRRADRAIYVLASGLSSYLVGAKWRLDPRQALVTQVGAWGLINQRYRSG